MEPGSVGFFYAGAIVLVAALYAVKELALRFTRLPVAAVIFACAIAAAVPATWWLDPDWDNPLVLPLSHYVGMPVGLLTVPLLSFLFDVTEQKRTCRPWRVVVELIAVLGWFFGWIVIQLLILGWIWI